MQSFLTLNDLAPKGKTVLLRADLNVPMQDGNVTDMTRITRLLPTIRELSDKGARVVILSHFGRPRGRDESLSLAPAGRALSQALGRSVAFANDCVGAEAKNAVSALKDGGVVLLENVRFHPEEEKDDKAFAADMASLGDVYVNDAFSCAHRAHSSTHAIANLLPAYAGRLMEEEIQALRKIVGDPERPVMAIVGGAKISTKLDLLKNLVERTDALVLGGGMANTFLAAQGTPVGKSLCERDMKEQALKIIEAAKKSNCRLILPVDGVVASELKPHADSEIRSSGTVPENGMLLDIGPQTVDLVRAQLENTKTVLWNGPMGAFETPPFDHGTVTLARAVAELTRGGKLTSVAGGGDTVAALAHAGVEKDMTYVSTAGGAFLEWLEGRTLPGVQILQERAGAVKTAKAATSG